MSTFCRIAKNLSVNIVDANEDSKASFSGFKDKNLFSPFFAIVRHMSITEDGLLLAKNLRNFVGRVIIYMSCERVITMLQVIFLGGI